LEDLGHESERPARNSEGVHCPLVGTKSLRAGVRACVVATKCRNGHGAKACRKVDRVKSTESHPPPAAVPARDSHAGEAQPLAVAQARLRRSRYGYADDSVWTDRMLAALDHGVQGGVWHSLIDKVWRLPNLASAWRKVARNQGSAGVDHVTTEMFERHAPEHLSRLSAHLRQGTYEPSAIRRTYLPKPGGGQRPLGIPTVRDRVVQGALRQVLEPIFERDFARQSYGFRPGRGCKDALRRVDQLLKEGHRWVVDADLKSYFDTIPHGKLLQRLREKVADGRVLQLVQAFLGQKVMEGLEVWTPTGGAPQGAVLSPLLSNIYLDPLDHLMEARGYQMVRYADDLVILCRSREAAQAALALLRDWVGSAGLTLHPDKTRVVNADAEGFEFLGYRFVGSTRWPRDKSKTKLKDAVRAKTRRTEGRSLEAIVQDLNRTLKGWFEYFKHAHWWTFTNVDSWTRMRLRSILRRRRGTRGRGRGSDHQRWPNAYFQDLGLFSLYQAWLLLRQPAQAVNH
jgi:RNA-directed DNA polymerase